MSQVLDSIVLMVTVFGRGYYEKRWFFECT